MTTTPGVSRLLPPDGTENNRDVATAVNQALKGKINSTGTVTLTHDAASTTVNNAFVSSSSVILLMPQTANASAEQGAGTIYIKPSDTVNKTSFKITHANNSQSDRTFGFVLLG